MIRKPANPAGELVVELPITGPGDAGNVVGLREIDGAISNLDRGLTRRDDELTHPARVFASGRLLDSGRHIDAPRPQQPNRVANVLGSESARDQHPDAARRAFRESPV